MPVHRSSWFRTLPLLLVAAQLAACGASTAAPTLQGIVLTPATAVVPRGASTQLVAMGRYSDGTSAEVSGRATWTSAAPSVASVAGSGLVTGLSEGSAEITATVEQWTMRATVTVGPVAPVGLEVTPTPVTIAKGQLATFRVTRYVMSDGTRSSVFGEVVWSSQPEAVATIDASGLAHSLAPGIATIRASQGSLAGTATLTVGPAIPVGIEVTPGPVTLALGQSATFQASQYVMSDGTRSPVAGGITWSSDPEVVATIDASGLARSRAQGVATIRAAQGSLVGTATLTVGPVAPVGIEVTPTPVSLALGQSATFRASQYVMSDGTRSPVVGAVTWTALPDTVATVDGAGLARSRAQGIATIQAAQGPISGAASLTVGPPARVSVEVSPPEATVFPGRPQRFTAAVTWTDGTTTDVTSTATWSSSNPAVFAMVGPMALCEGRGSTVVSATDGGVTGTATLSTIDARIAFTTSSHGAGNLGAWSYGVGRSGAQAADAICQSSARAGRLPGTYRALLSDATDDAYCRLHGLGGTVAGKCGQAILPASAGPWMRTDGQPYAARVDRMLESEVYNPLGFDEYGFPSVAWPAFTGTSFRGTREFDAYYGDCAGWTSTTDSRVAKGAYEGTTSFAIGSGALTCDQNGKLMCFEVGDGEGPALPPRTATGKLAFMTSVTGPGYLAAWADAGSATGIAAGDAVCRARAAAAGFANAERFKAWLSDATTHARDRITSDGPWVRPDRVLVAANKPELLGGTLSSSISMTETGRYVNWIPGVSVEWQWSTFAWTGTTQEGTAAADHCLSWQTAAEANGAQGWTVSVVNWSHLLGMPPSACSTLRALYCLED